MKDNKTPRVDAFFADPYVKDDGAAWYRFTRQIERELSEVTKQRDEARRKAEHLRNCAHGKFGYCHPSSWLPWEVSELECEPSENA